MAKCSELSQTINDLALEYAADPELNTIAKITHEMNKDFPRLTEEDIANAINEATVVREREADASAQNIAAIKREGRGATRLREANEELARLHEEGRKPPPPLRTEVQSPSRTLVTLRKTKRNLTKWLRNSDQVMVAKLTAKLDTLLSRIAKGDIDGQRKPKTEFREPVRQLQVLVRNASKKIASMKEVRKIDAEIDMLNEHLENGTLPDSVPKKDIFVPKELEVARRIRGELKKKLRNSDAAAKKRIEAQIKQLDADMKSGAILAKPKVSKPQRSAEVQKLQFELNSMKKEVRRRIRALVPPTVLERFIVNPFGAARNIMTAFDLSAVFRQGGFLVVAHPKMGLKAIAPMFKALISPEGQAKIEESIKNRPNASLYELAGLFLAPTDGDYQLTEREENQMTTWFDRIPGGSKVKNALTEPIRASNRAYATYLNVLRADSFDAMVAGITNNGVPTLEEAKTVAKFVNTATGRGSLGKFEDAAGLLNTAFFAPRYVTSRFQLLGGLITNPAKALAGKDKRAHRQITKTYARYLIGMGVVYALSALALDDDEEAFETDPRSADFGKIRIGKTRIDPLSGISQVTVLLSRVVSGKTKSSTTGKITPIRGKDVGFGRPTTSGIVGRFLRYKLSPMFGTALSLAAGEDPIGQPFGPEDLPVNLLVPLAMRDIHETITEQGIPAGSALSVLSIFGAGIQTYGSSTMFNDRKF